MLLMSYVIMQGATRDEVWFLDSGCSNHMSGYRKWFIELDQSFRHNVKLGNDSKLVVMGKGKIRMKIDGRVMVITEVFYIPDLKSNLLSIGQLQERNLSILIKNGCCSIYHDVRGCKLTKDVGGLKVDATTYKQIVESLYVFNCHYAGSDVCCESGGLFHGSSNDYASTNCEKDYALLKRNH
ncbi:hypothetical protein KIW84_024012 [Lathyrus oleraceus]|uniref:Retrovirus-related Pol polyprotein from transposon TNT 1-94-like beta-barrel domain-containing protein n=1 Tax=Pisum sativum TaxID=3888 RepID=A0A9D4YEG0_PEA|nr:hypothetical protein KIW84_024012 [Pisum sativum]